MYLNLNNNRFCNISIQIVNFSNKVHIILPGQASIAMKNPWRVFFVCLEIQYRIMCSLQHTTETFIGWAWCTKYSTRHNDETYISDLFIEILIQPYMYKKTCDVISNSLIVVAVGGFLVGTFFIMLSTYPLFSPLSCL